MHKKNKTYPFNHYLKSCASDPGYPIFSFGPAAGVPDEIAYIVTYEYDWYATPKRMNFPNNGGSAMLFWVWASHKRNVYQIATINPADWCTGTLKKFTKEKGAGYILAL